MGMEVNQPVLAERFSQSIRDISGLQGLPIEFWQACCLLGPG
jgi:hypothetical protein